jgi:lipoyl(octanoyl) transferase
MTDRGLKRLLRFDLGRTKYYDTWLLQKKLIELRFNNKIPDCLLFTEHDPVITKGRGTKKDNLLVTAADLRAKHIDLVDVERGGDITFHGPGQAVMYPIIDLNLWGRDLHGYLRSLENMLIETLKEFGLEGSIKRGLTGAWVTNTKVAAIGIAVSRWIAYHGVALNVTTDLDYFKYITPCGITQFPVGSIESLTGKKYELSTVFNQMASKFSTMFFYDMEKAKIEKILERVSV